jgi:serine protease AprX
MHRTRSFLFVAALAGALPAAFAAPRAQSADVAPTIAVERDGRITHLALQSGAVVRSTDQAVQDVRVMNVPGSSALAITWNEADAAGGTTPWYAISLDGASLSRAQATAYSIAMSQATFDPLAGLPDFSHSAFTWDGEIYMVQFHTQVLAEYRAALEAAGARVYDHLVNHTLLARMTPAVRAQVEALEVVRWVGAFHPELRLEPGIAEDFAAETLAADQTYTVAVWERGIEQKQLVADRVTAMGGVAFDVQPEGFLFQTKLSPSMLSAVIGMPEVAAASRWFPGGVDMDIARQFSGADYLETQTGFTGQGVRGEVFDTGVRTTHVAFAHDGGVLLHGPNSSDDSHGTSTTGICFGDGSGNPAGRGVLPNGKIIFGVSIPYLNAGHVNRYAFTAQIIDPGQPYQCVFQTNSTGSSQVTTYTPISQMMDDILFGNDIVILQSQSNLNSQNSRPEAWAKNIVSVGGINHGNTLTKVGDNWGGASIGPATDGRIKPDLAHFYDSILCTSDSSTTSYTTSFGGTSGATPITAAHFGLFFQMWHNNVWNNGATGATVFDSRSSARLARAAMINTASQWTFSGAAHNLTRTHQGWGAVDMAKLYDTRNETFYVDETDVLNNLQTQTYSLNVGAGEPELKATLVYRDPKAVNFAGVHRINNLSLRVTSPTATVYWGNNGLNANMWSPSGGAENNLDVVENVFVQNPTPGTWLVEVLGSDINTDVVPSVAGNNADFALWVTGVADPCPAPSNFCTAKTTSIATQPSISFTGTPSQAINNFVVTLANAVPSKPGLVIWGSSSNSAPFQGGFLCVGGTPTRGPGIMITPAGTATTAIPVTGAMVGTTEYFQWWFRDPPAAFGTGLSNGLQVQYCP